MIHNYVLPNQIIVLFTGLDKTPYHFWFLWLSSSSSSYILFNTALSLEFTNFDRKSQKIFIQNHNHLSEKSL